jgi:hypothetical protein
VDVIGAGVDIVSADAGAGLEGHDVGAAVDVAVEAAGSAVEAGGAARGGESGGGRYHDFCCTVTHTGVVANAVVDQRSVTRAIQSSFMPALSVQRTCQAQSPSVRRAFSRVFPGW